MKIIYRILNREGTNSKINLNNINIIQINGLCGEGVGGGDILKQMKGQQGKTNLQNEYKSTSRLRVYVRYFCG